MKREGEKKGRGGRKEGGRKKALREKRKCGVCALRGDGRGGPLLLRGEAGGSRAACLHEEA